MNGSPVFYELLERMAAIHDHKSHDYASNDNPYGNYQFAGKMSKLFDNPDDAGFMGRIAEKLFRLANLENSGKVAKNETIQDTEIDICTITVLWMASRQERRNRTQAEKIKLSNLECKSEPTPDKVSMQGENEILVQTVSNINKLSTNQLMQFDSYLHRLISDRKCEDEGLYQKSHPTDARI